MMMNSVPSRGNYRNRKRQLEMISMRKVVNNQGPNGTDSKSRDSRAAKREANEYGMTRRTSRRLDGPRLGEISHVRFGSKVQRGYCIS